MIPGLNMGEVIVADSMNELVEISDGIAGEHVHIHCKDYKNIENELKNYGSLFINENSSVVFSDKVSGTNHTLPTNRAARFTGGLWVGSYLKVVTFQEIEDEGIQYLASHAVKQSNSEGLHGHKESARFRLN
jgi:sulfopropanediol 3-dehydrogenase